MRTPSPSYCRLDLAPPLADRFIFGVAPIDYGPVLLLMPFGFHLAMDTCPPGTASGGSRSALAVSSFRLRARLGFSIPTSLPAREALPPRSDMALLIRAPEGLQLSGSTRCSAHHTTLSDFRSGHHPIDDVGVPPPPGPDLPQLPRSSSLHAVASTPVDRIGACRFLPHSRGLPRLTGGSASTTSLSGPAQASLALRPARSQPAQRRTLVPRLRPDQLPGQAAR